jgi:SAM-dependent methyltransferase
MNAVPKPIDPSADAAFRAGALALGLDPDERWVGGYIDYEWKRSRHVFELLDRGVEGQDVLEFGCNYGATAVVLTALGARVTAVDVDASCVQLAQLNAARFGMSIRFEHVVDTTALPFAGAAFDIVSCNSVLEYVPDALLDAVQKELDRVLKPGGLVVVLGTSNRLWPKEVHSGRWFVNYLPRPVDRLLAGAELQRGVPPWRIVAGFGKHYANADRDDGGRTYLQARIAAGATGLKLRTMQIGNWCAPRLGTSMGLLTPSMSVILRKLTVGTLAR